MDDENCVAWTITFHPTRPLTEHELVAMRNGAGVHADLIPGTFRPVANRDNGYLIDREAQKTGRYYNGVKGLAMQDASVQESMGAIADRSNEHLVSTDVAIIKARTRLRKAALGLQKGEPVPGLDPDSQYVRSASFILPVDAPFHERATESTRVRAGEEHVAV
jgi:hypothetical protein